MVILDIVAAVAPYVFVLPFLWIAAAYLVAAIRVRHTQPRRQVWSIVAQALWNALFWPLWLIVLSNSARSFEELGWKLLWYGYFIVFPLLAVYRLKPTSKVNPLWRKIGFARADDLLLFRPLPESQPLIDLPDAPNSKRWIGRPVLGLMLGVSLFATGLSFVGNSLQPCEWLDIATGRSGCLKTWPMDRGSAYEIALSPDGSIVAANDLDGPLKIYNVSDGKLLYELPDQRHECGESVSFSANGALMATISTGGEISIRDVKTWMVRKSFGADVESIQFSPDGRWFAASMVKSGIRVWRTTDWKLLWILPVEGKMRFTADGRFLAAYGANQVLGFWSMDDGSAHHSVHTDNYRFLLSPDGTQVATFSYGDALKLWDAASDSLLRTIPIETTGKAAYSSDGQYLLIDEYYQQLLYFGHQVGLWRVADGQRVAVLPTYLSTNCMAFASKSNVFGYSSWQSLKVFRLRQY